MNLIAQRITLTRRPILSLGIELRWQRRWICLCSHLPGPSSNQQQLEPTNDGLSPEIPDSAKAEPSMPSISERVPKFVDWTEEWTKAELQLKELAIQENKWTPVYRFKSLVIYWIVLRFTLFFVCFSIFFLVAVICQRLKEKGTVDLLDFWPQLLFLGFAILTNYLARRYLPRLVAVISVDSRSRSIYRIGHMTGLGFRRNEFARLGDIRPLAYGDTGGVGKLPKLRWTFRPQSEYLLLPMTDFEISDKEAAYLLFGSIQYYQSPAAAQLLEEMAKAAELEAGDEQQNVVAAGMEEQKQQQHESTTPKMCRQKSTIKLPDS